MTARARYDPRAGLYVGGGAFGLRTVPELPAPDAAELELLVRFEHPAKFLAVKELPGGALLDEACLAAAYGCPAAQLARVRAALAEQLERAADALLADPGNRQAVGAFPVAAGGIVVALGDSITDDLLSWAELLRRCLDLVRPGEVTVVNAGVSGDTTADGLGRAYGIAELRPDLVIGMLGTNDCQRHGPERARLISADASCRNAARISAWLARTGARVVWLTPPPVDAAALRDSTGDRPFHIDPDDIRRLSALLLGSGFEVLDTGARLDPAAGHLLPDGVHPSLAGQQRIAEAVLRGLAS